MPTRPGQLQADALVDALFDRGSAGMIAFDAELTIVRVNARLAEMLAMEPAAVVGRTIGDVAGEAGARVEPLLRGVLERGEAVSGRVVRARLPSSPDREREFVTSYVPLRGDGGEVIGVAGTVEELTDHSAVEAERDRLLKEALVARAHAEAAQVRAEGAQRDAERARARTAFIAEAGARMATMLDTERAMAELARISVPAVADWCVISLLDRRGALKVVAVAHARPELEPLLWDLAPTSPLLHSAEHGPLAVLHSGRPELLADIREDDVRRVVGGDERHVEQLRRLGLLSSVTVPLKTPSRRIGTVTLVTGESGRRYSSEDVAMARALAARASLHAENARLYTESAEIARTLQDALVPDELPAIPGVDLAVRYRAAGDQNRVGGDFYDVYAIAPERVGSEAEPAGEREAGAGRPCWTVVVGDVSGKGAEAAVLTGLTRHTLYAAALRDADPVANLLLLNEALLRRSGGPSRFCTLVTATLRRRHDGTLGVNLANAGHPPPLVLRADGTIEETTARGTLVGAMRDLRLAAQDLVLRRGDLLLLYTDGVTELRTEDPAEGLERLRGCLAQQAGRPAAEVVAAVEASVAQACGGAPHDDVALLAVRAVD